MLFRHLRPSAALNLEGYADVDQFHESERYAGAESIPLQPREFSVLRASLALPSGGLSLVRTFPRLINGYHLPGRLVIVVPMDGVSSTRLNGKLVGQSVIVLKGSPSCTVLEPEGRLVAILSVHHEILRSKWIESDNGYLLLDLPADELSRLRSLICSMLEFAARDPEAVTAADVASRMQDTLFAAFEESMCLGELRYATAPVALTRYKTIVDRVDHLIGLNPIDTCSEKLAEDIGISQRTLQMATRSVCGSGIHGYSRLKRMWSVRRQLRTGATGLTVKASALAHGFWHMSEFSSAYRAAFGELPSSTLTNARHGIGSRVLAG